MDYFPWGVAIGLGIVLLGTLVAICYILCLDHLEQSHATQERSQSENSQ
jgi:hypothetical protein